MDASVATIPSSLGGTRPSTVDWVAPTSDTQDPKRGPLLGLVKNDKIAFVIVGVANTGIGALWFVLFEMTIGRAAGYMASLVLAHVAAVLTAFVLSRTLVFPVRGHVLRDLARFWVVYLTGFGINLALLPLAVEVLGLAPIPAQLAIVPITAVVSYVGQKYFAFRRPARASHVAST